MGHSRRRGGGHHSALRASALACARLRCSPPQCIEEPAAHRGAWPPPLRIAVWPPPTLPSAATTFPFPRAPCRRAARRAPQAGARLAFRADGPSWPAARRAPSVARCRSGAAPAGRHVTFPPLFRLFALSLSQNRLKLTLHCQKLTLTRRLPSWRLSTRYGGK